MHVIARHWPVPSARLHEPAVRLGAAVPIAGWRDFSDWLVKRVGDRTRRADQDDESEPADRPDSADHAVPADPTVLAERTLPAGPADRSQQADPAGRADRPRRRFSGPSPSGRPRGGALGQMLLIAAAWLAYSAARSLSGDDVVTAVHRGLKIQQWDQWLGFGFTHELNHWITGHGLFAVPLTFEYASLHYVVTPLVLVWLWQRHIESYRPALYSLLAMSATGLVVYVVLPVAPPRLLPGAGWLDTMSAWSHLGWWGGAASAPAGFANFTDQFAAMPSLHVGWAVWCAFAWYRVGGKVIGRLGWLYPALVAVTVIVTANHYVLDVVAGAALAIVACLVVPRLLDRSLAHDLELPRELDLVIDLRDPVNPVSPVSPAVEARPLT